MFLYASRAEEIKKLWLSYKAIKCVQNKHRVFKKYKDSNHPACKRASNKAITSNEVRRAKYNYEKKLAENTKKDSKSFFAYVRGRSNSVRKLGPLVNSNGEVVDSSEGMSELFNESFGKVFTKERLEDMPKAKCEYKDCQKSGLCDIVINEEIVMDKLKRLRDDKASGADELVPRFLSKIENELVQPLTRLFKKIVENETVPRDWKDANVIPIFKGGTKSSATNYRPISLTSQLCKVFEAIVRDQVVKYLEDNRLIRDSQHGFRKGSSTLTNLLLFLDKVLNCVDEVLSVDIVFLDLAKAFDKVPHRRLLGKMRKLGIGGRRYIALYYDLYCS